ncbi:MAG: hypothetical protein AAGA97_00775 [Pseudomonadota bacterium]
MKTVISGILTERFRTESLAPPRKKKKHPAPLSIRLSEDERAQLQSWAGRKPLSTYVKECLFKGRKPRKAANSNPVQDYEALARVLGALGRSGIFRNLDGLAKQAEEGTLDLSDDTIQAIVAACLCVSEMRNDLVRALGLKAD